MHTWVYDTHTCKCIILLVYEVKKTWGITCFHYVDSEISKLVIQCILTEIYDEWDFNLYLKHQWERKESISIYQSVIYLFQLLLNFYVICFVPIYMQMYHFTCTEINTSKRKVLNICPIYTVTSHGLQEAQLVYNYINICAKDLRFDRNVHSELYNS